MFSQTDKNCFFLTLNSGELRPKEKKSFFFDGSGQTAPACLTPYKMCITGILGRLLTKYSDRCNTLRSNFRCIAGAMDSMARQWIFAVGDRQRTDDRTSSFLTLIPSGGGAFCDVVHFLRRVLRTNQFVESGIHKYIFVQSKFYRRGEVSNFVSDTNEIETKILHFTIISLLLFSRECILP